MPRRYFARFAKQIHYKGEIKMGGDYKIQDPAQEAIDGINAAIDRLDAIIKKMQDNLECKN